MNNWYNLYNLEAKNQNQTQFFHDSTNEFVKSKLYFASGLSIFNLDPLSLSFITFLSSQSSFLSSWPFISYPMRSNKPSSPLLKKTEAIYRFKLQNNRFMPDTEHIQTNPRKEGDTLCELTK